MRRTIIFLLRSYHKISHSFWMGAPLATSSGCRLYPTCSEYSILAIERYGVGLGLWRGILRVLRCNPLTEPHVDLP